MNAFGWYVFIVFFMIGVSKFKIPRREDVSFKEIEFSAEVLTRDNVIPFPERPTCQPIPPTRGSKPSETR